MNTSGTRAQLLGSLILGLLFFGIAGATFFKSMATIHEATESLDQTSLRTSLQLATFRNNVNGQRAAMREMLLLTDRKEQEARHDEIQQRQTANDQLLQTLAASGDAGTKAKVQQLVEMYQQGAQVREKQVIPALYSGQRDKAIKLTLSEQNARWTKLRDLSRDIDRNDSGYSLSLAAQAGTTANDAADRFAKNALIFGTLAAIFLIWSALLAWRQFSSKRASDRHGAMPGTA